MDIPSEEWYLRRDILLGGCRMGKVTVILASASPRRKELLGGICSDFLCVPARGEEQAEQGLSPQKLVCDLARAKALDAESQLEKKEDRLIIGSDTVVSYQSMIMGKPKDREEARLMLSSLSGHTHSVFTGVAFIIQREGKRVLRTFFEEAKVTMYPMSEKQIDAYLATGEPFDKAGAYAIQGKCAVYIKKVEGEYNTVVGFPIARIYQELLKEGIELCES